MIKLRNLIILELLAILLLCTGIGAFLFMSNMSSFWRERYSRDAGIIRQAFLEHRNEILNGNTRGFESTLSTIAGVYGINSFEVDYRITGKTVQIARDSSRPTFRECKKPDARTVTSGQEACFTLDFAWSRDNPQSILSLRWWVLPDGLDRQKRAAILILSSALLLGLLFSGVHWLLINKVVVVPVSQAVARFDRWVRQERRVEPLNADQTGPREITDLIHHFDELMTMAEDYRHMRDLAIQLEAQELVARQVKHDLRSPLSALKLAVDKLSSAPSNEARALAQKAFQRLNEILATLGGRGVPIRFAGGSEVVPAMRVENLFFLLEPVVAEHSLQVDPLKTEVRFLAEDEEEIFSCVDPVSLRRALSNLLNNAIEALPDGRGRVSVRLARSAAHAEVTVSDNGVGMPAHVLERLGQKGVTHGKEGLSHCGSGLGVYQAISAVDQCSGAISFESRPGQGTTVRIRLPEASAPAYWCREIPSAERIVIVDDEISTHRLWREKFYGVDSELLCFLSAVEFEDWHQTQKENSPTTVYLLDFSIGQHQPTGFDLVTRQQLPPTQVVIVSGIAENAELQIQAEKLGVQLLHKRHIPKIRFGSGFGLLRSERS